MFGAIFDDSDFDPQPAMQAYDTHVAPFMRKYATPPAEGGPHPHSELQQMLGKRNCYNMWREQETVYDDYGRAVKCIITGEWRPSRLTTVKIHGKVVGVAEAETRQVAERLAFAAALAHVRTNPGDPPCHCKRK